MVRKEALRIQNREKIGNMQLIRINILFLFIAFHSFGQKESVVLTIEPRHAEVGEIITITVRMTVHGQLEIDNLPSSFVRGYQLMNGMESEMDQSTGALTTYYYVSQTGAIGTAGKYKIGPAYIKKGNKTYSSNTVEIHIGEKAQMATSEVTPEQLQDPAFGVISTNKKEIYEGEPILVTARVYAHFDPTHLEGYRPYTMTGTIDKHPVGHSGRINKEQVRFKGLDVYSFEYDKNLIFPIGTGKFKISPYRMNLHQGFKSFMLTSSSADVLIKPLPANPPADFIGAVGAFKLSSNIEEGEFTQGDVIKLTLTISGTGNLQNISSPKPQLPKGLILYGDPEIEEAYTFTSRGAEGAIQYTYNLQVNAHGKVEIPAASISYFDVEKEKYVTLRTNDVLVQVKENPHFVEAPEVSEEVAVEEIAIQPALRSESQPLPENTLIGSPLFWFGITSPFLAAFIFIIVVSQKKKTAQEVEKKRKRNQQKLEIAELLSQLKVLSATDDDNRFYAQVEALLKVSFAHLLPVESGRSIQKKDILAFLEENQNEQLSSSVRELFAICEQNRFGFSLTETSKQEVVHQIENILTQLKS